MLCVLEHVGKSSCVLNANSSVSYNDADVANSGCRREVIFPLAGRKLHNVISSVHDQVVDADNCYFRAKLSSQYDKEDIGPYSIHKGRQIKYY